MSGTPKNMAASVKTRLPGLARKEGEAFQSLLVRFGAERLPYRLSQSPHADKFLLKGAMLFAIWDKKIPRPTRDVDFLAFGPIESEIIAGIFREIVRTPSVSAAFLQESFVNNKLKNPDNL